MIGLLDWRRRTHALYAAVRALPPAQGHALWVHERGQMLRTHPASPRAGTDAVVAPYDPTLRCQVPLTPAAPQRLDVATGTDGVVPFERVGRLRTPWGPLDAWALRSYGGGLWVPVRGGAGAYGGGRYLLDTVKGADLGGNVLLDLNFLYNPSCAYDEAWACPLAPPGNVLELAARVGELLPAPRP